MSENKVQILVPCQIFKPTPSVSKAIAKHMPSSASFAPIDAQPDLLFMRSILVSTGENKNDDVFLPEEMWNARSTPVLKPVDWEHNTGRELTPTEQAENPGKVVVDNQTIGVMYNAFTVDENNVVIDEARASASDFEVPEKFHIIDEAVIWKALYPSVARRVEEGAANGTLFVSMEAWFTDYHYLVGSKVVARNEQTAFLDRALRANGGSGSYGGERVRRALRNITFGGKGIVARPANEPSIITHVSHEPMSSEASLNKTIAENIICDIRDTKAAEPRKEMNMADNEKQVSLELYTKASEENVELRAQAKNTEVELAKANEQVDTLKSQASAVESAFVKGADLIEALIPGFASKVANTNPENFFGVIAEILEADQAAKAELKKQLDEAVAREAGREAEARAAAREAKIDVLVGLAAVPPQFQKKDEKDEKDKEKEEKAKAKKQKMLAAVEGLSDEQFDALYDVWAEQKAEADEMKRGSMAPQGSGDPMGRGAAQGQPTSATEHGDKEMKKKDDEDEEKAKAGPGKRMASEDVTRQVFAGLLKTEASRQEVDIDAVLKGLANEQPSDEDNLMALLENVKASEQAPSAGEEAPQGVDLNSSFGSMVNTMLGRNDENN